MHFFISKKTPGCARTSPVLFNDPSTPSGGGWVGQAPPITRGPSRVASTMRALCIYFLWKITCPRRLFHTVWLLDTWEYKTGTWNRNLSNMISVVKTELLSTLLNLSFVTRTTDTQWRHKSKTSEKLGRCGRQNMLPPYLKIWEWEWIFGRAVKAVSSLGVRSPCPFSSEMTSI